MSSMSPKGKIQTSGWRLVTGEGSWEALTEQSLENRAEKAG